MKVEVRSRSAEETFGLGVRIGRCLEGSDILLLDGEMGAGKTVLAKGLYAGIGGPDPDQVVSPSYTVVNLYTDCGRPYYHVDLYRLEDPRLLLGMEYEDFLYLNEGLTVVEWPRSAPDLLDDGDYLTITIRPGATDAERILELSSTGDRYAAVFAELEKTTAC